MNRRQILLLSSVGVAAAVPLIATRLNAKDPNISTTSGGVSMTAEKKRLQLDPHPQVIEPFELDDADWKMRLDELSYQVLRLEGTERPFTSPLNDEKREGEFACLGCNLVLTTSEFKFDSGTGWPSFFDMTEDRVATKTDFKIGYPRTEYHCVRCGGHQGHVFKDGPQPTGLRYCNNGAAMKFIPA